MRKKRSPIRDDAPLGALIHSGQRALDVRFVDFVLLMDQHVTLARARDYPYAILTRSFVYRDSGVGEFERSLCTGRTPVLAIGSNQSPRRLAEKFGDDASHVIPVQRARLKDFDVVYSAHISTYGAVPAMLQVSAGSKVDLAVTWLNDAQLEIMNHSEVRAANYAFAQIDDLELSLEGGGRSSSAYAYVSSRGHLRHEGDAVALTAIACSDRRYPEMSTDQALEVVRGRAAPEMDADAFVLKLIGDESYRRAVTMMLTVDAVPFAHPFALVD